MWFGDESTASSIADTKSDQDAVTQSTEDSTRGIWLNVALRRELMRVYSLDDNTNRSKDVTISHMPFRGDNCESIFLM